MKARIVLAGLLVSLVVAEASAQRAEYDDLYFRAKDRERNKAIDAEDAYASAKITQKQKQDVAVPDEDNTNPTDSYSARNVNPEYVSRSNSEKASEDESNYYLEGYIPPASATSGLSDNYYNNTNWAASSYYANSLNNQYYGNCGYCGSGMSPYYGGGFYDPWMSPAYGYGPSYGWNSGWSISFMYGNYWSPYGSYGYGNPYYGGYGYPGYYGGNGYYESPRVVNYGKRPTRNSATTIPIPRPNRNTVTTNGSTSGNNVTVSNGRTRTRQTQDEYYVRPSRRTSSASFFDNPAQNSGGSNSGFPTYQNSQPARTRETYSPPTRTPSYTPSSSPSSSPSRGNSGSGGGGGSSPRRGRG